MKRILLLAALALALPTAVFAGSSIDFTSGSGILRGSAGVLSLSGSPLIAVNGLNGGGLITGNDLGSIAFQTGTLTSFSATTGDYTFAAGGWFTIAGNGTNGVPSGTLFTGAFSGPVSLNLVYSVNGTNIYDLSGALAGTTASGFKTSGVSIQLVINTGKGPFDGSSTVASVDTTVLVPEPGSLGLLGTGLIGLAGVVRRKLKS
jgi:PEP-CTERM motif